MSARRIRAANSARRWPRPPLGQREAWVVRERQLLVLGFKAQEIAFRKAHLGDAWRRHFLRKANALLDLAQAAWSHR